jgi:transposase-like protein
MFIPQCPKCALEQCARSKIIRHGVYYRTSDGKTLQRYRCLGCKKSFSAAIYNLCYRQKKRQFNGVIRRMMAHTNSLRETAKILGLNRTTVVRKAAFLGIRAEYHFRKRNLELPKATEIEFDDLETFEHTKYKPVSVTLAVESKTRRILGIEVSVMPGRSSLAKKAIEKYGYRPDQRRAGRRRLFERIKPFVADRAVIKSDANPHYPKDVKNYFPKSVHQVFEGRKPKSQGQGELKKGAFDPLFSVNHTCAMLRANVNRLIRKTWCTTKSLDRLYGHLMIYADEHNERLSLKNA